ncbi:MAG TPA: hypothetical protein VFE33_30570 [Thermoanaerobaculia bacterium]|nr:hypothetical protein [Thermoanaerobaculia bacterium]
MKNFAFVVAFVLLSLAVPASAAEIAKAAPAATVQAQTPAPLPWLEMGIKPLLQRCSLVQGTSCPTVGATMACTDACNDQLSCTCIFFNGVRFWDCLVEC